LCVLCALILFVYVCICYSVTGAYTQVIFRDVLGLPADNLMRAKPLPDFGGDVLFD